MPDPISYLIVVAILIALLSWLAGPWAALGLLALLTLASTVRWWTRRTIKAERRAFLHAALPTYGVLMLAVVRILMLR